MANIVLHSLSPFSASIERTNDGVDGAVFMFSAHPDDLTPLIKLEFLLNTATMYVARWNLVGPKRMAELSISWQAMSGRLWSNFDPNEIKRIARERDMVAMKTVLNDMLAFFHPNAAKKAMAEDVRALFQALSDFTGRAFEIYVEPDRTERFSFIPELSESYPESWHADAIDVLMYNTEARGYVPTFTPDGLLSGQAVTVRFTPKAPSDASTALVQAFIRRPKKLIDDALLRHIAEGPSPRKPKPSMSAEDELRIINASGER